MADQTPPKEETKEPIPVADAMLQEVDNLYTIFRGDLKKIDAAIETRKKTIENLQKDQTHDFRKKLKTEAMLAGMHSLLTRFRGLVMDDKKAQKAKAKGEEDGENTITSGTN